MHVKVEITRITFFTVLFTRDRVLSTRNHARCVLAISVVLKLQDHKNHLLHHGSD